VKPVEEFAFLDPWSGVLPDRGVVAVAGSGGCTTVLLALVEQWRERGRRVLVSQTVPHPVPYSLRDQQCAPRAEELRVALDRTGCAWTCADPGDGRRPGIEPDLLEELRVGSRADVVVVQTQESCGQLVRTRPLPPVWPHGLGLAVLVAQVGAVGRTWTGATGEADDSPEPRRVELDDLLASLRPLLADLPPGVRPLPFLTGLGAWRDLDGMFRVVQELWQNPGVLVVALAELLGDERREHADLRGIPERVARPFEGRRIYAVYPAELDTA